MSDDPSLDAAYALKTPEDSARLYRDWAGTYDATFAEKMDYQLHEGVAEAFVRAGGKGPVLDLGAGTGLVGEALVAKGVAQIDGTDISPEMLAEAALKDVYDRLFEGDILDHLDAEDDAYAGVVSAGTFTLGHVGPDGLHEAIRVLRPGGLLVISVRLPHYEAEGFADALAALPVSFETTEVRVYGASADKDHAGDTALIVTARKAG